MPDRNALEMLKSFRDKVLGEQWEIGSWIQEEQVTANELDDTLAMASVAIDLFLFDLETSKRKSVIKPV